MNTDEILYSFLNFLSSSIFIQINYILLFSIFYSFFVVYIVLNYVWKYTYVYNIFNSSFNFLKFIEIFIGFGAFYIVIVFQSGNDVFKLVWNKFEAINNNIGTYTNDFITSLKFNKKKLNNNDNDKIKLIKKYLCIFPYSVYYLHATQFISDNKLKNISLEFLYSIFNICVNFYTRIRKMFKSKIHKNARILDLPIFKIQDEDSIIDEIEEEIKSFTKNSKLNKNDMAFECIYSKLQEIILHFRKREIINPQKCMQMNILMRQIVSDSGNITSTSISARSKPQIELLYFIEIFYFFSIPWFLISLIPENFKFFVIIFTPMLIYLIIGTIFSGNRLRNIFTFRSFQRSKTFLEETKITDLKVETLFKIYETSKSKNNINYESRNDMVIKNFMYTKLRKKHLVE